MPQMCMMLAKTFLFGGSNLNSTKSLKMINYECIDFPNMVNLQLDLESLTHYRWRFSSSDPFYEKLFYVKNIFGEEILNTEGRSNSDSS